MLYPIELLRHESPARTAVRRTASMVTGSPVFVMSSTAFLSVGKSISTFARRAKCIPSKTPSLQIALAPLPKHKITSCF